MRLTPSLAELTRTTDDRRERAEQAASELAQELLGNRAELEEHDFQIKHELGAVEVRRGPLSIARVVFNYGDTGKARVFSEVLGEPGEWLRSREFDSPNEAIAAFKKTLYDATTAFYKRRDEFRALGLI
jgi:hypothetical protein